MNKQHQRKLLRLSDVSELTSLGKSTINLWVTQGRFPAPTPLSKTIKVWHYRDVERWLENFVTKQSDSTSESAPSLALEQTEVSDA
jgi:prophage regulatory protein